MAERRTDVNNIGEQNPDTDRTLASQGGPATGIGDARNRVAPTPLSDDLQTQAAAASTDNNDNKEKQRTQREDQSVDESQSDGDLQLPEGK